MKTNIKPFLLPCSVFIIICLSIASLAGWVTESNIATWYNALQKPSFNPPAYVFGPVWTTLYILIGISGGILWHYRKQATAAFVFYLIQLAFNFAWSFIFFGAHQIGWALVDMILMIAFIVLTITQSLKVSTVAALLLLPYLSWVLFACVLNANLWILNSSL